MEIVIKRLDGYGDGCVIGVMYVVGFEDVFSTLELPWNENRRGESCIPKGEYKVVRHFGAKYKDVWRLEKVFNREGILIHCGNSVKDTKGCILIGMSVKRRNWLLGSREAYRRLKEIVGENELMLRIE